MFDFNTFINSVQSELETLVKENYKMFKNEAIIDAEKFLQKTKSDLQDWTSMLIEGKLSKKDYEWLVKGKKDLAEMHTLKQKGMAHIQIQKFRDDVINIVVNNALKLIPGDII